MPIEVYGGNPYHAKKHADRTKFDSSQFDAIFKDTDYWDTYQAILSQYSKGPAAQWFGFLGADAKNAYNHNHARMDAINALIEQKRIDEYNSSSSQVERDRAAGLNPDLLGASGGEPSSSASTSNEKEMQFENPLPHIISFMSLLGNAAIGAQSMISQQVVNDGMRLQNLYMSKDIALDTLGSVNPFEEGDIKPAFKLGYVTGSRSLDKKLERISSNLYGSMEHQLSYRSRNKDINQIRKDNFDIISSPGYNENDDVMNEVAADLADLQLQAIKASSAGESERKKIWNETLQSQGKIINRLKKKAKRGNVYATRLLLWLTQSPDQVQTSGVSDATSVLGTAAALRNPTRVVKHIK